MKRVDLSNVSMEDILLEIDNRSEEVAASSNKNIAKKAKQTGLTLGYMVDEDSIDTDYPYFILGIIKDGKFLDFYYNSEIDFDKFQKYIPNNFVEAAESIYEWHDPNCSHRNMTNEQQITHGKSALESFGYTEFKNESN